MFLFILSLQVNAQTESITQVVRGTVVDKVTQAPMPGAVITILNIQPAIGTATNEQGLFILKQVPVGRQTIKVTYIGYKPVVLSNITVNSGKEVVLNIEMEEEIVINKEVVVKANRIKNQPLNEMSTVSTRTFSVEETQKFAAAVNDPARMATSFAGVVGGNDGNNMISVRGNSPFALLWRMEGVEIPNPNHFSNVGTSGGGISILSAQLLANSDFLTGAFASEYGNALGGVFDLRLRKGNNQKREYTFQAGILGIDIAAEGPIRKGYEGSYLINYRYSTLSLFNLIGLNLTGDAITTFQDLSFNVHLPTKKYGTFGFFGLGGLSTQTKESKKDSSVWTEDPFARYAIDFVANTGVVGLNNTYLMNKKSVIKTALVLSGTNNGIIEQELNNAYQSNQNYKQDYKQTKLTLTSTLTTKLSSRNNLRTGFILNQLGYQFMQRRFIDSLGMHKTVINNDGSTQTFQSFLQWQHKFNNRITVNTGLHSLFLFLNKTYSIEPRMSVKFQATDHTYFALGYGLHSQIQPLGTYFAKDDNDQRLINKNLKMSRAHHVVFTFDRSLNNYTHLKIETYYQYLFNIPTGIGATSHISSINSVEGFSTIQMRSNGVGKNYGIELTAERFLHKNFYYILSMSLYESLFQGNDRRWYNTLYNTNFATTFTSGKEWTLNRRDKNKVLGINIKAVYVGGLRYTPINEAETYRTGEIVYDNSRPFTLQNPNYFRIDVRVSMKRNFKRYTRTISLDLQNATNRLNVGGQYYDETNREIKYWYQSGIIPILAYRLEF